jgi:hypothetical protein
VVHGEPSEPADKVFRPEPLPELPAREDGLLPLVGRSVKVAAFAVLVALLAIFGKSLLEGVSPLNSGSAAEKPNHGHRQLLCARRQPDAPFVSAFRQGLVESGDVGKSAKIEFRWA